DDLEMAAKCFRQVLFRHPEDLPALRSLARVLRRSSDWNGLAEILATEFDLEDDPVHQAGLAIELGNIHLGPLEDPDQGANWFEKAISLKPAHPAALGALDHIYEERGQFTELVRVWETILRSEVSDTRKKTVCVRLGKLYEDEFSNLELALKCYKSALSFDPKALGALRGIQRVARAAKNFDACRMAFEKEIALGGEPARLALLHQGVGILLEKEDKHKEALVHFEEASRLGPGNREILRDLIDLYEKQSMHAELAGALERWARLAPTGVEKAETLLAAARVSDDHLKDSKSAFDLLQRAAAADPNNPEVLQLLGNLLYARGDHQAVVDLLHREIELASDREKKSRLLLRAAQIYEDPLGDSFKAAECLQEAVRLNPQGGKGLRALRDLQDRFGGNVPHQTSDQEDIPGLLAEAHRAAEGDPPRAKAFYLSVLDADPLNTEGLEGMVKLFTEEGDPRQTAVWLSLLAGALDEESQAKSGGKPSVFFRLGRLLEEEVRDPGRAVEAYFRAWELAPGLSDAREAVLRLGPEAGRWEEYQSVRSAAAADAEPQDRAAIYQELAQIEEEDLGRLDRAASWIRKALETDPLDPAILTAASRVFEATGDQEDLAAALARSFEAASRKGESTADEAARIARIYVEKLHDPEGGADWFAAALERDPADASLLAEARETCMRAGRVREADRLFQQEIEASSDGEVIASLHRARASMLARDLG
ncbi:MAG: hypothetical protein ACYTFG_20980, partial [Planctomycetota bacterium]